MNEFWTSLSGLLVSISGLYYAVLIYRREAPANAMSWFAWSFVGLAMFLTSGTVFGLNAITFGVINPTIITAVGAWRQRDQVKEPPVRDIVAGFIAITAIGLWALCVSWDVSPHWTLALAIAADVIPLWPILHGAWKNPQGDKPFAWLLFGYGFGIGAFGLHELSVFTLALPVYMFVGANVIAFPLMRYRIKVRAPARQWV